MDAKKYRPSFITGELQKADERGERKCLMCPTMLPKTVLYYCSGSCMTEAKARGIYGNEDPTVK
jgi:hypothetical protein